MSRPRITWADRCYLWERSVGDDPMPEDHPLRPARGLMTGALLSIPLWIAVWVAVWVALP